MMVVVVNFEANLAHLHVLANHALVFSVIDYVTFAAHTLELAVVLFHLLLHLLIQQSVRIMHLLNLDFFLFLRLLGLFLAIVGRVFLQDVQGIISKVGPAERTLHWLA